MKQTRKEALIELNEALVGCRTAYPKHLDNPVYDHNLRILIRLFTLFVPTTSKCNTCGNGADVINKLTRFWNDSGYNELMSLTNE